MKEDHSIIIQIGPHAECLKGDQQYFSRTTEFLYLCQLFACSGMVGLQKLQLREEKVQQILQISRCSDLYDFSFLLQQYCKIPGSTQNYKYIEWLTMANTGLHWLTLAYTG